ncbi:MAG: hypothetical protein P1S60_17030 [Anaerolineae bacterium]|nr:hypothetical protein [Anaerolineae bacterium]
MNWRRVSQLLLDGGYDGWLVAEIEVAPKNHKGAINQAGAAIEQFIHMVEGSTDYA